MSTNNNVGLRAPNQQDQLDELKNIISEKIKALIGNPATNPMNPIAGGNPATNPIAGGNQLNPIPNGSNAYPPFNINVPISENGIIPGSEDLVNLTGGVIDPNSDLGNTIRISEEYLRKINDYIKRTNNIAMVSSVQQAEYAMKMAAMEAEGTLAQLVLNDVQTKLNIETDLSNLASRFALQFASKAMESATLIAQFREKMLGLFITLSEQRANNSWGRIKSISQNFKF